MCVFFFLIFFTGVGGGSEGEDSVVAIKRFKELGELEDEHTRNYVHLTQVRSVESVRLLVGWLIGWFIGWLVC